MTYRFKTTPELVWFVLVAAATAALQFLMASAQPTDWQPWLVSLGAATVRAGLGALLSAVGEAKP